MLRCFTARRPLPLPLNASYLPSPQTAASPLPLPICARQCNSSSAPDSHDNGSPQQDAPSMTPAERSVASLLTSKLSPTKLLVQDISGGCGTMYAIHVTSPIFRGHPLLKQQRMVNLALGDLVKSWHGLQLRTSVPEDDPADES
ncbi:hypothetical protein CP532_3315 [Ophiocordyceps camponoti-leonardi (nom. inval.)]|nr:hypothetical protein CP532_3315 [Ophiocordyceps camponoti-leonardi (nom. inval.)]